MSGPAVDKKHIVMVAHGTPGDVSPLAAVAKELTGAGHDVSFVANPTFRPMMDAVGARLVDLGTEQDQRNLLSDPNIYAGTKAMTAYMRQMALPMLGDIVRIVRDLSRNGRADVVVHHPVAFGAESAAKAEGVRTAVANPFPVAWDSRVEPGVTPMDFRLPNRGARAIGFFLDVASKFIFDRPINRELRALGLPPVTMRGEFRGGDVNLGMWSPHFRGAVSDDPPQARITGFALLDQHRSGQEMEPQLSRFLDDGAPPVVFTLGTGVIHQPRCDFYGIAAEACKLLGMRGVLLIGREENRPPASALSSDVFVSMYAPFSQLLPRAAMVVHHGGLSTTAQTLRAGKQAIVIPSAYDQFDDAYRVKQLGVGERMDWSELTPELLAARIRARLNDQVAQRRTEELARLMANEDGAKTAAKTLVSNS